MDDEEISFQSHGMQENVGAEHTHLPLHFHPKFVIVFEYGTDPRSICTAALFSCLCRCVVCVRGALPPLFFAFHFRRGCDTHTRLSIQHIFSCFFFWFSLVRSPTTTLSGDVFSQPNSVWSFGRFGMNKRERAHEAQKA